MERFAIAVLLVVICVMTKRSAAEPLYVYTLHHVNPVNDYDEALAAATLQGIINRDAPSVYVLSPTNSRPKYWLDLLSRDGRWLSGRRHEEIPDLTALVKLAGARVKGAVIWDPDVPATVNVATTIAGVEDAVVLSPELAQRYLGEWNLHVVADLFTGQKTGSKKNDAYRWAIDEYLAKGRCSPHLLCLYEDSFSARAKGDIGYVVTRDWAVKNRAFVFDLSPWGDEAPGDEPEQKLGTDLATYRMILEQTMHQAAGKQMTEMTGFFAFSKYSNTPDHKSRHEGVPTEWESVWLISPYNCYQNTISSDCYNQSLHSHFPRRPLKQRSVRNETVRLENKAYIAVLMADYDSATPLYDFLPKNWENASRGKVPLAWGINPNLLETYPDLIAYFYETASAMDMFTSDASAAGYMNPSRVRKEFLPLFVEHNVKFFREADMTMASMVLDQVAPSDDVKDAFAQFARDGYATIIADVNQARGTYPPAQVWKGMPIAELFNDTCNSKDPAETAEIMARVMGPHAGKGATFHLFRIVWTDPEHVRRAVELLKEKHPETKAELVGPREFFWLFKESLGAGARAGAKTH